MTEQKWNDNWKFWRDRDSFSLVWNVPEIARNVTLPHDAMIEQPARADSLNGGNTGFRDAEVYTYVKTLAVPESAKSRSLTLKFEGVYMNAFVYVNGQFAAKNPFGYTTFYVPLNDFLSYGQENEIRVQVRAGAMTNSRWYSGAGIYRDVYLLESDLTHLTPDGVRIKTENADEEYATLKICIDTENGAAEKKSVALETVLLDADGNEAGRELSHAVLTAGEARTFSQRITVEGPKLWSDQTPALYTYRTALYEEVTDAQGKATLSLLDKAEEKFGIRTLSVDAKRGLRVNGKTVKLRGACIHHDSGLLGAATYEDAQFRQIRLMKAAGFNAIRMSHHPMAPAMLRACDEIGMYVMDEAFDMWNRLKSNYDYGLYFREWWEKDVAAMVKKDYNHPSVVLYSVGNEIPEIGTDYGSQLCQKISDKIHSLDDSRFTLAAINGVFAAGDAIGQIMSDIMASLSAEGKTDGNVNNFMTVMDSHMDDIVVHDAISRRLEKACAGPDIAGYNYMTARYEGDGVKYPNRVIVGSETYPPEICRNWALVEKLPYVIGDFTWTGWDYLGEAGVGIPAYHRGEGGFGAEFPAQLAYSGDIDITGFRRPASYYREAVFGLSKKPYIAVQNPTHYGELLMKTPWVISDATASWSWSGCEGKPVIVEIYSAGDEAELLVNGASLGRKPAGRKSGFRVLFETTYQPGILTAVSYENGKETGRSQLVTAESERHLTMEEEPYAGSRLSAQELIYIQIKSQDQNGNTAADDNRKITLTVEGSAEILGFGSGDPKPAYNFNEGTTKLFDGRAQLILKKPSAPVKLTVTADDGTSASLEI